MADSPANQPSYPRLRLTTRIVVGVAALAVAVGLFVLLFVTRPRVEVADHGDDRIGVRVFEARQVPVRRQWQGYGTVEPIDVADVPARVTTTVAQVPDDIRAGRSVDRGELLMKLDDSDFVRQAQINRQQVAQLEAQLDQLALERGRLETQLDIDEQDLALAQAEYDRIERITERLAANQQQLDNAKRALLAAQRSAESSREALASMDPRRTALQAQLDGARAQLELAQLNVERCTIQSPIAGVLAAVDVDEGEQVQPGRRVAQVVSLDRVEAPLRLPAAARRSVTLGDAVTIASTSDNPVTCEAQVRRLSPVDDPQTRTLTAYVEVDQHHLAPAFGEAQGSSLLVPGVFVSGRVTGQRAEPRWIVPRRSVRGGRLQVIRDGQLVNKRVEVEFVIEGEQPDFDLPDTQWAVLAGDGALAEGQLVLVDGGVSLMDGQPVKPLIVDSEQSTAARAQPEAQP